MSITMNDELRDALLFAEPLEEGLRLRGLRFGRVVTRIRHRLDVRRLLRRWFFRGTRYEGERRHDRHRCK